MVKISLITNEIRPDGEFVDRLAAAFEVCGQQLTPAEGDARFIQVGIPVYSERYGRLIDFDTDGEEWARNLPSAYRNGAISVVVHEDVQPTKSRSTHSLGAPALALQQAHSRS